MTLDKAIKQATDDLVHRTIKNKIYKSIDKAIEKATSLYERDTDLIIYRASHTLGNLSGYRTGHRKSHNCDNK